MSGEAPTVKVHDGPSARKRRSLPRALLASLRPKQWTKNGALLAALIFAQKLTDGAALTLTFLGVLSFCCIASAVYVGNDVADRERDLLHPEKRHRPIAAGEVPLRLAAGLAAILVAAGLAIAWWIGLPFFEVVVAYLVLQLVYNLSFKHLVVLDVFAVAAGFVLRVVAGAEAIAVPISNWLYLCTLLLSLFLALTKRRAELTLLDADAAKHRKILVEYSVPFVDQLITVVSACTVLAYALYTLSAETVQKFGTDRLKFTIPFVLFGLFRYLYLVHKKGAGGAPERVLLADVPTQVNIVCYLATVAWALYFRGSP